MCNNKIKGKKSKCLINDFEYKKTLIPELISKFMFDKSIDYGIDFNDLYLNLYTTKTTMKCTLDVLKIDSKSNDIIELESIDVYTNKENCLENISIVVDFLKWVKDNATTESHPTGVYWKYKGCLMDERVLFTTWLKNSL